MIKLYLKRESPKSNMACVLIRYTVPIQKVNMTDEQTDLMSWAQRPSSSWKSALTSWTR